MTDTLYDINVYDDEIYGFGVPGLFGVARYGVRIDEDGDRHTEYESSDTVTYVYSPDDYLEEDTYLYSDDPDVQRLLELLIEDDWGQW